MRVTLLTSTFALVSLVAVQPAPGSATVTAAVSGGMGGGESLASFADDDRADEMLVSILEEASPVDVPEPLWCETDSDTRCNPDPASQAPSFRWPAPGGNGQTLCEPRLTLTGPIKRHQDSTPIGSSHLERVERPPRA